MGDVSLTNGFWRAVRWTAKNLPITNTQLRCTTTNNGHFHYCRLKYRH